ncbi:DNA-binding response regulator [Sphingomonas ginkgonis]|uniref:DNA-binding response regulator n=1 Tax=Sphingomonas ginkgonis TaxID=2315330 RepID=A0A429VBG7_9SPHN|nr:response regulator transcription factor [Sphingomonas ginkgonis]RST31349.1 DNA-binding response regulator [Sphingomonas ginkgonis]
MKILIIEDVQSKFDEVRSIIVSVFPGLHTFQRAFNLNEAEDAVMMPGWDLVIVDLSMDINGSGAMQGAGHATLGGLDVLERMALFKIAHPTIVVTGFDSFQDPDRFDNAIMNLADISGLASDWLGKSYIGSVRYGAANWNRKFSRMLQQWSGS